MSFHLLDYTEHHIKVSTIKLCYPSTHPYETAVLQGNTTIAQKLTDSELTACMAHVELCEVYGAQISNETNQKLAKFNLNL